MPQTTIRTTPVKLASVLGIADADLGGTAVTPLWRGYLENLGPATLRMARSPAAPAVATVLGSRFSRNTRRAFIEYSGHSATGGPYGGPMWVWAATGAASLWHEAGEIHGTG